MDMATANATITVLTMDSDKIIETLNALSGALNAINDSMQRAPYNRDTPHDDACSAIIIAMMTLSEKVIDGVSLNKEGE